MNDSTPEERRLRESLERERTPGGWPEHLQREHPDVFPAHGEEARNRAERRGVRRLLQVTVPIIVVLLFAGITGTLIGDAWLLALLVGLAGWAFYAGFVARDHVLDDYRHAAQVGFVVVLFLIALAGYFGLRQHRAVAELAVLVDPIPEITAVTYVPTPGPTGARKALLISDAVG